MPRRRPTHGGIRLPGNKQSRIKLRTLMPRIGFDFVDKRCRAMLAGVGSSLIKEQINNFFFELNKPTVDKALAMLLEKATKVMENEPDQIADMMPGEFWGAIKQTVPWAKDISGTIIFKLVAALLAAHETCLETYPYEKYSTHYGRLATSTHNFSMLLQQHHMDNYLLMSFYYNTTVSLGNESDNESVSEPEEDKKAQAGTKRKQDEMEVDEEEDDGSMSPPLKRLEMDLGLYQLTEEEDSLEEEVEDMETCME